MPRRAPGYQGAPRRGRRPGPIPMSSHCPRSMAPGPGHAAAAHWQARRRRHRQTHIKSSTTRTRHSYSALRRARPPPFRGLRRMRTALSDMPVGRRRKLGAQKRVTDCRPVASPVWCCFVSPPWIHLSRFPTRNHRDPQLANLPHECDAPSRVSLERSPPRSLSHHAHAQAVLSSSRLRMLHPLHHQPTFHGTPKAGLRMGAGARDPLV